MSKHRSTPSPFPEPIAARIARFDQLTEIAAQRDHDVPQAVADLIWSRRLLPVLTRADDAPGPFGTKAPIKGAGDMSITLAACPPGTGPSLHTHRRTFETFTVLKGLFEFAVGEDGEFRETLRPFDTISVPPGLARAFRNIGDEDGLLQVIITGGVHDVDDITFPSATARAITRHGERYLTQFRAMGLRFGV